MLRKSMMLFIAIVSFSGCELYFHDLSVRSRVVNKTDSYFGRNAYAYIEIKNDSYKDIYDVNGYVSVYRNGRQIDQTSFDIDWIAAGDDRNDKIFFQYLDHFRYDDEIRIRAEYEDEDGFLHRLYDND